MKIVKCNIFRNYIGFFAVHNNFNQKLENLPNSLRSLTLGYNFNKKLNACLALPKLQILKIDYSYKGDMPIIFGTTIMIGNKKEIKSQVKQNYDYDEWKDIFYKSITFRHKKN